MSSGQIELQESDIAEAKELARRNAAKLLARQLSKPYSRKQTVQPDIPSTTAEDLAEPALPPLLGNPNLGVNGTVYIAVSNVPQQIRPGGGPVRSLAVYTPANTSTLYIGQQGVNSTTGFPIPKSTGPLLLGPVDLGTLWIVGATAGDSLSFIGA
jgi:hypothetical protein